jgi:uncharacterized peroxidase-related enzyme
MTAPIDTVQERRADPPISRLRVPAIEELSSPVRSILATVERSEGHLPNWLPAFALGGDHFERLAEYLIPLLQSGGPDTLTDREREIIATVVSVGNGCAYCHTHHVHALGEVLGDHWLAARIGIDHREVAELSEREHALASLALKITRTPRDVSESELDQLRALGLSDETIFEAIQVAAIINATNRITLALNVLPDRAIFGGRNR